MPIRQLPSHPNLDHLRYQAKDLLKARTARDPQAVQRIREFHPRFNKATDAKILDARLTLSDAQLAIAREYGYPSWARLKQRVEEPTPADDVNKGAQERIEDVAFRRAVDLVDAGDAAGLRAHLKEHPNLALQHVVLEGGNYFRHPTLLEFVAENPIRHGALPANVVEVAEVILDAGAKRDLAALNRTLELVSSGSVARECGVQLPLIDLLCDHAADPSQAMSAALAHGEFEAVNALIRRGAPVDLPVAAALGRMEDARRSLSGADAESRHRALALASQFGHTGIVRLLLEAGEDPNRYNPVGFHSHSTPLHQAALAGHLETVRLLVEHGARLDARDTLWQATAAGWAHHQGRKQIENYLLSQDEAQR